MRYGLRDIFAMLRTPIGRWQLRQGLWFRCWPVVWRLAWLHRRTLARRTRVVAVVGSFGKTTTARATLAALDIPVRRHNLSNSWSNVAAAVLRIRPWHRHAVIEVGLNAVGQMARYAEILRPDVVIVTSIGSEHHRSLGSLETTRDEKAAMLRRLRPDGLAVLNGDDANVLWMKSQTAARVITFGHNGSNDVGASHVVLNWPHGTRFQLQAGPHVHDVRVRLVGTTMMYPILAAVAVAQAEGFGMERVLARLEQLPPTPGRLQPVALPNGAWILRDDFKSGLETFDTALSAFEHVPAHRRLAVLGDVTEPPGSQGPIYREIGETVGRIVDQLVVVGKNFQRYATGAKRAGLDSKAMHETGGRVSAAVEFLQAALQPGDVVLIKGRHDQRLERISLALQGRTVRCDIECCDVMVLPCVSCPMLERGWADVAPEL